MQPNSFELPISHALHGGYKHPACRNWVKQTLSANNLVYPVFVLDEPDAEQEIKTMPGIKRFGYKKIVDHLKPLVKKGLQSIIIFGILSDDNKKDERGSHAGGNGIKGPTNLALEEIKKEIPELLLIVDVCLCAFTSHGHCGLLNCEGYIDNAASLKRLVEVSISYVQSGAQVIAPSDMMDGRIGAIKQELIRQNLEIPVMSYAAKFASSYYGPFRDACKSAPGKSDRQAYQLPLDSTQLALKAVQRDLEEGADYIMVKPITTYLDIVKEIKQRFNPIMACYHVSGEYAMVCFAAQNGACDKKKVVLETMRSFRRAGIDIIITYFTPELLDWVKEEF
ncbi:delta-aminolevulinic acid dehydratase (macronuclear) [Tetrahymena thermophila SB210]|uniref:Delta-aminolevulinic acid dehydratase n=1 Tax=Tetrahymena thermophila (strain SB210) TaxID=312017 RepID=Q22HL3_TETTS|nr:delta-aminolevulinic acid dehydratase [Tetrahymena thermophila SB210]EAR84688.1 delta-aminolevulinic acid dehydratase [Tetrahymena thermophila SB210]|eukprot:XP_001032351.1 delta-aminolevulinic acid dehydratase [Tetrahymena thermophila SB210]